MCSLIPRLSPCRTMKSKEEESLAPFHMQCCSAMWEPAPSGEALQVHLLLMVLPTFLSARMITLSSSTCTYNRDKEPTAKTTLNSTIYWMVIPVTCESIHELHWSHSSNSLRTELVCYITEMFSETFLETLKSACAPLPHTPQMKFMRPASSWHFVQLYDADIWNVGLPITEQ